MSFLHMTLEPHERINIERDLLQLNYPGHKEGSGGFLSQYDRSLIRKDPQLCQDFSSRGFDLHKMTLVDADKTFSKFVLIDRQPVLPNGDDFFVLFRFIARASWEKRPDEKFPPLHPTSHHLSAIEAILPNAGELLFKNPEVQILKTYDDRSPLPSKTRILSDLKLEYQQLATILRAKSILSKAEKGLKPFTRRFKL